MAILKKTTVVAKPAAKPAAKVAAKPVVKATVTKVMTDKKTGKATKSAPVAMKSKSITAKEFNADKKAGYGAKDYSNDSVKVRKSLSKIDSIDKETNKNLYIPALGGRFMNPGDDDKRKTAQDSLMSAGKRMMNYDKSKKKK